MRYEKYRDSRFWAVLDDSDELVCLTVYRKGAEEVIRRIEGIPRQEVVQGRNRSEVKKLIKEMKETSRYLQKVTTDLLPRLEL